MVIRFRHFNGDMLFSSLTALKNQSKDTHRVNCYTITKCYVRILRRDAIRFATLNSGEVEIKIPVSTWLAEIIGPLNCGVYTDPDKLCSNCRVQFLNKEQTDIQSFNRRISSGEAVRLICDEDISNIDLQPQNEYAVIGFPLLPEEYEQVSDSPFYVTNIEVKSSLSCQDMLNAKQLMDEFRSYWMSFGDNFRISEKDLLAADYIIADLIVDSFMSHIIQNAKFYKLLKLAILITLFGSADEELDDTDQGQNNWSELEIDDLLSCISASHNKTNLLILCHQNDIAQRILKETANWMNAEIVSSLTLKSSTSNTNIRQSSPLVIISRTPVHENDFINAQSWIGQHQVESLTNIAMLINASEFNNRFLMQPPSNIKNRNSAQKQSFNASNGKRSLKVSNPIEKHSLIACYMTSTYGSNRSRRRTNSLTQTQWQINQTEIKMSSQFSLLVRVHSDECLTNSRKARSQLQLAAKLMSPNDLMASKMLNHEIRKSIKSASQDPSQSFFPTTNQSQAHWMHPKLIQLVNHLQCPLKFYNYVKLGRQKHVEFSGSAIDLLKKWYLRCRKECGIGYQQSDLIDLIQIAKCHCRMLLRSKVTIIDCLIAIILKEEAQKIKSTNFQLTNARSLLGFQNLKFAQLNIDNSTLTNISESTESSIINIWERVKILIRNI